MSASVASAAETPEPARPARLASAAWAQAVSNHASPDRDDIPSKSAMAWRASAAAPATSPRSPRARPQRRSTAPVGCRTPAHSAPAAPVPQRSPSPVRRHRGPRPAGQGGGAATNRWRLTGSSACLSRICFKATSRCSSASRATNTWRSAAAVMAWFRSSSVEKAQAPNSGAGPGIKSHRADYRRSAMPLHTRRRSSWDSPSRRSKSLFEKDISGRAGGVSPPVRSREDRGLTPPARPFRIRLSARRSRRAMWSYGVSVDP